MNHAVSGLHIVHDFLGLREENDLLQWVDNMPWLTELKRRVQHYGYKYDYKKRQVDPSMYLGPLPKPMADLAHRMVAEGLAPVCPDQVIVNEYQPGQGISAHVDCVPCFQEPIISLSLGSACVMRFTRKPEQIDLTLRPRVLLVLNGEAAAAGSHLPFERSSCKPGISAGSHRCMVQWDSCGSF